MRPRKPTPVGRTAAGEPPTTDGPRGPGAPPPRRGLSPFTSCRAQRGVTLPVRTYLYTRFWVSKDWKRLSLAVMSGTRITPIPLDPTAQREGYLAGRSGIAVEANPYQAGTHAALAWGIGWVSGLKKQLRIMYGGRSVFTGRFRTRPSSRLNKTAPEPSQYRELCRPERGEQPASRLVRAKRRPALARTMRYLSVLHPRFGGGLTWWPSYNHREVSGKVSRGVSSIIARARLPRGPNGAPFFPRHVGLQRPNPSNSS